MKQEDIINLLNKMTIDEKIGQMMQTNKGSVFINDDSDIITGPHSKQNDKMLYKVGSILNKAGFKNIKKIQDAYLEKSRLKIPLLFMGDIINGYKTIFPCPLAQGCSWNTRVIRKISEISRQESAIAGINVVFSPMVDLARDARWGRCLESIGGEDPFLAKTYAKIMVEECQKKLEDNKKVQISCVKHFAAYGAVESGREYNTVDISERELMEYYMKGYKSAIDSGAQMIMTSFNIVNGVPATINKWLLDDLLRKEWGFKGVIITDYNAIQECVNHGAVKDEEEAALKAIQAGVDIDMMSGCYGNHLRKLLNEKKITISQIDECVLRILNLKNELGLFENPYGQANERLEHDYIFCKENLQQATRLTEETMVLLKNKSRILPLDKNKKVALIGPYAHNRKISSSWTIFGEDKNTKTLKEIFEEKLENDKFEYSKGCETLEEQELIDLLKSQTQSVKDKNIEQYEKEDIQNAIETAKRCEIILLAIGEHYLQSGEGCSRSNLEIPQIQLNLLNELYKLNKPIVAVLFNGRPTQLNNVENKVDAILEAWMPGTKGAEAIFNILYGKTNPSGKLTMSFPQNAGQCPIYYNHYNTGRPNKTGFRFESRYIDIPTESFYPFGYGLSYSKFVYSKLKLNTKKIRKNSEIILKVNVKNDSPVAGKEVIQLYIQDLVGSVVRPIKELKAFKKEYFLPYEEKEITFEITEDMLMFLNNKLECNLEKGNFKVFIGTSSADTMEEVFEYIED